MTGTPEANPILPAGNEAVWAALSLGVLIMAVILLLFVTRWAALRLGGRHGS